MGIELEFSVEIITPKVEVITTEEFEMFFDSVKWSFEDTEKRLKYAQDHKKKDEKILEKEFETITTEYKAAMNVKFELEEWKKEEDAEMEIEIPEEEALEIK